MTKLLETAIRKPFFSNFLSLFSSILFISYIYINGKLNPTEKKYILVTPLYKKNKKQKTEAKDLKSISPVNIYTTYHRENIWSTYDTTLRCSRHTEASAGWLATLLGLSVGSFRGFLYAGLLPWGFPSRGVPFSVSYTGFLPGFPWLSINGLLLRVPAVRFLLWFPVIGLFTRLPTIGYLPWLPVKGLFSWLPTLGFLP